MTEPRTISRILDFFHIPLQHSPDTLRDIYLKISKSCDFDNFIRIPAGARLESVSTEGTATSSVSFLKDRVSFQEEQATAGLEHLLRRIEETVKIASELCSIPLFIARSITFRAVLSVPKGQHSTPFLSANFFSLTPQHFGGFDRPGQLIGFRMQFPPQDPTREPFHQVRIESYLRDPRSLFIEDSATFKMPIQSRDSQRIATEAREVETFLNDRLGGFIDQFTTQ